MTNVKNLSASKKRRRKSLRYLRWASKAAFLLLFMVPIAYVPAGSVWQAPYVPVTSLLFPPGKPFFYVPITQSPCSVWLQGYCNIDTGAWLVEPLGAVQALLTGKVDALRFVPTLIALFLVIVLIVLLGNAFCSWACPVGTVVDSFDKGVEKFLPKIEAKRAQVSVQGKQSLSCSACPIHKVIMHENQVLASGVLASALVGSAIFQYNVFCTVCPIGILTRGMFHLKATTFLTKIIYPVFLELLIIPVVAVVLSLRERRFWCNKLCPVGALLSGVAALNPFIKPKVKQDKCIMKGCPEDCKDSYIGYCGTCRLEDDKKCEKVCPVGINLVGNGSLHRCTKCFECYIACDYDAIKVDLVSKPDIFRAKSFFKNLKSRKRKNQAQSTAN